MSNKTAMQELIERLEFIKSTAITDDARSSFQVAISSAKSRLDKERDQIINAHLAGQKSEWDDIGQNEIEYYNETFGNDKQEKQENK